MQQWILIDRYQKIHNAQFSFISKREALYMERSGWKKILSGVITFLGRREVIKYVWLGIQRYRVRLLYMMTRVLFISIFWKVLHTIGRKKDNSLM